MRLSALPRLSASLDVVPFRAHNGQKRARGRPSRCRRETEIPGCLVELRDGPRIGEIKLLGGYGARDLDRARRSGHVELGRETRVRREERAEDVAGAARSELDVPRC